MIQYLPFLLPLAVGLLILFSCFLNNYWSWKGFWGIFALSYIPIAILVGAYNYHRWCGINPAWPSWDRGDRSICSMFTGLGWPLYISIRLANKVTDPLLYSTIKIPKPVLKWE